MVPGAVLVAVGGAVGGGVAGVAVTWDDLVVVCGRTGGRWSLPRWTRLLRSVVMVETCVLGSMALGGGVPCPGRPEGMSVACPVLLL